MGSARARARGALCAAMLAAVVAHAGAKPPPRVVALGFDGLDAALVERLLAAGQLPNLQRLAALGGYVPVLPANPANSPHCWAAALSGRNAGATGIFDSVRREFDAAGRPKPVAAGAAERTIAAVDVDRWLAPLSLAEFELRTADLPRGLLVRERALEVPLLFDALGRAGIQCVGLRVPHTFPALPVQNTRLLSGAFTPDVTGGAGRWYRLTNDPWAVERAITESGGAVLKLQRRADGRLGAELDGPLNCATALAITPRPERGSVEIVSGSASVTALLGQPSDFLPVEFDLGGSRKLRALARFHLMRCERGDADGPVIDLFVPPLGVDPSAPWPGLPIGWPPRFPEELAAAAGPFSTVGWTSATNAYKDGAIDAATFIAGTARSFEENVRLLETMLARRDWNFLLEVFGVADHVGHLAWRCFDPEHPGHEARAPGGGRARELPVAAFGARFPLSEALPRAYCAVDAAVGRALGRLERGELGADATLIVFSDHGMAPFAWECSINDWLAERGWLARSADDPAAIDWSATRAYALGFGQVWINRAGREPLGIVADADFDELRSALAADLLDWCDPARDGARVVQSVAFGADLFRGPHGAAAPDLVVGFAPGYRVSSQASLGGLGEVAPRRAGIATNFSAWSGDHVSVDPGAVRGVVFASRPLRDGEARVLDLAPTLLAACGVAAPAAFEGRSLLR